MKMTIGMKTIVDSLLIVIWNLHVILQTTPAFISILSTLIFRMHSFICYETSMQIEDFYESVNHGTFELVIHIVAQQYSRECIFSQLHIFLLFNNEI